MKPVLFHCITKTNKQNTQTNKKDKPQNRGNIDRKNTTIYLKIIT